MRLESRIMHKAWKKRLLAGRENAVIKTISKMRYTVELHSARCVGGLGGLRKIRGIGQDACAHDGDHRIQPL